MNVKTEKQFGVFATMANGTRVNTNAGWPMTEAMSRNRVKALSDIPSTKPQLVTRRVITITLPWRNTK